MRIGIATSAFFLLPVAALSQPAISFPESFVWNAESRGPLMMVLPLSEKDGQLVTCGSVTAFAPKSYATLRWEHLPEPDLFGQMGQNEKWELLQASLTERQWKLLGGNSGLGQTDLTRDQKKLFFSLLPEPITVVGGAGPPVRIAPDQRRATRLRLSRRFSYSFTNNDGRQVAAAVLPDTNRSGWQLTSPVQAQIRITTQVDFSVDAQGSENIVMGFLSNNRMRTNQESGSNFGATLTEPTGTHLKPSDLDYVSPLLDARVSLEGATTVRELIERTATATKQELFCDPRYAKQKVYLRGTSARAGDVLKALCWGVSGTFRRVGSAYVLTENLIPLAIRMGHIAEWRRAAQARVDALRVSDDAALAQYQQRYLTWNDNTRHFETAWRYAQQVPLSELSPALRGEIQRQMDQWASRPDSDPNRAPLNRNVIQVNPRVQLELLVPNIGTVPANWGDQPLADAPEDRDAKPFPFPAGGPPRTLAVTITTVAEAKEAVRCARAGGFKALWVQVGLDDLPLLSAAIVAGKAQGIPVSALVRPLRASGPREQTVEQKRSATYLRPDLLESQAAVLPKLKALAATPDLAGLVFTDLIPTGYFAHNNTDWKEILGYADPMRLACLRRDGPDPVDLSDHGVNGGATRFFVPRNLAISLDTAFIFRPTFLGGGSSGWFSAATPSLWQPFIDVRGKAVDDFVEGLTQAVHKSAPGLPLLRSKDQDWDLQFEKLRCLSLTSTAGVLSWNDFVSQYRGWIDRKPEGLVLEGTQVPLGKLLPLLEGLKNP